MKVYEYKILTKKRSNSKKWEISETKYSANELINIDTNPKKAVSIYCYNNAESIQQVHDFNQAHNLIVMSPLGSASNLINLDMNALTQDSLNCSHVCSVTGKKTIIAHCRS